MARNSDAYEKMKAKMSGNSGSSSSSGFDINSLAKKEGTYWVGAGAVAGFFIGFVDAGLSVAVAYGAKKLYDSTYGKK